MADRVCTRFIDDDGLDIGCHLVSKEYMLEAYPELVPWMKTPALWSWGYYTGTNTSIVTSSPTQTISNGTNWKSVSKGGHHTAAIKTDGTLWLWGGRPYTDEHAGVLGDNSVISRSSPVQTISNVTTWKSVSTSGKNTAAIKTDGTLWTWGLNSEGQLGNNNIISASSPVQTISNVTTWKQVSIGGFITAAIKTDGTLWTWGFNIIGGLGTNNAISSSSPVQTISGGTNWKCAATKYSTTAGIKTDGALWLWGQNYYGLLGTNNTISSSSPVQTISSGTNWKEVCLSAVNTAAIKTDGTLWLWGLNNVGALGNNNMGVELDQAVSSPVQTISGGTNWKQVAIGSVSYTTVGAIKTDGSLWFWGINFEKRGLGVPPANSSPVQSISSGTGWRQISLGGLGAAAIRDEGEF